MIKNVTMEKRKILMVGFGSSGLNAAKALALKHNPNLIIIIPDEADDLGFEIESFEMAKPKPFIIDNIRVEYLQTPKLWRPKPKNTKQNNWKRKLKKNKR